MMSAAGSILQLEDLQRACGHTPAPSPALVRMWAVEMMLSRLGADGPQDVLETADTLARYALHGLEKQEARSD